MTTADIKYIDGKFVDQEKLFLSSLRTITVQLEAICKQGDKSEKSIDDLQRSVQELKVREVQHFIDCPNTKKIELMEEQNADLKFYQRNPKVFFGMVAVNVISMIIIAYEVFKK